MTRPASRKKAKIKKAAAKPKPRTPTSDRAVYLGLIIVGFFAIMLASMFWGLEYVNLFVLLYVAMIAYLVNVAAMQIYRGRHLAGWQQSLAKVPLRFAGYGTKHGKPLDAAHGHPEVLKALTISLIVSLILLAIVAFVVARGFR